MTSSSTSCSSPFSYDTPKLIKAREFQLGDIVRRPMSIGLYDCATVKELKPVGNSADGLGIGTACLFRPYVITVDFSCGGIDDSTNVICYIGIEIYEVPMNDNEWELLQRVELR